MTGEAPQREHMHRRAVGTGAMLAGGASIVTAALGALLGVVVARSLGPADTGTYNLVASTLLVLVTVATLGINVGATYLVSNQSWLPGDALRQLQAAAVTLGVAGAAAAVSVALLTANSLYAGVPITAVVVVACALPAALSWTFTSAAALALDRYELFAFTPLVVNLVALVLGLALAPTVGVLGAVAAIAAGHLAAALMLLLWARRSTHQPQRGWATRLPAELRHAVSFGFRGYVPQALQLVNYRADLFILNAIAAGPAVGNYAVALVVSEVGLLVPRALSAVVLPRVAALDRAPSGSERNLVIVKSVRHALLLVPITWVILSAAVTLIPLVFGPDFSDAVVPGLILAPGVAALGVSSVLAANTIGSGRPELALYAALLVTPVTLALYGFLIPRFEVLGAAVASTASYALSAIAAFVFFRRAIPHELPRTLLPTRDELIDYQRLFRRSMANRRARPNR